ncbi:hypothetical protein EDD29_2034 [Actinocorallia herbida]|uniref:Uncharacterized protein n=1 Tax=Actinocorallia herbida TaxID=58109 RepID=A0A3N1CT65_9ACTN|nr:hypothetical protein [Actinocorallia herbida]ROO84507.1 hypothetical protein EDD29_2034 [Actinocorallia herbida]
MSHLEAPGSEVWAEWREYAEKLDAEGDPRGQAILLEHRLRTGEGDAAGLVQAYRRVERRWGLDGLREDGSWRFTWSRGFLDEARFRAAPHSRPRRGALVERLAASSAGADPADAADPERWEAALIDALLRHPAAARLRRLDLRLTDHHHSAGRAAAALAEHRRDHLAELRFGHAFEYLYEDATTSTGARFDPMDHYDTGFAGAETEALWAALPALRTLELEGALLFHWVGGEGLTDLRLHGAVRSDGGVLPGSSARAVTLPNLASLAVETESDVHGTECPVEQLEELTAGAYPALRSLDLARAHFDTGDLQVLRALADTSVLPGLTRLRVRSLEVSPHDADGDPLAGLAELAPRFAHLALSVAGAVAVEGADPAEVAATLPLAPWPG